MPRIFNLLDTDCGVLICLSCFYIARCSCSCCLPILVQTSAGLLIDSTHASLRSAGLFLKLKWSLFICIIYHRYGQWVQIHVNVFCFPFLVVYVFAPVDSYVGDTGIDIAPIGFQNLVIGQLAILRLLNFTIVSNVLNKLKWSTMPLHLCHGHNLYLGSLQANCDWTAWCWYICKSLRHIPFRTKRLVMCTPQPCFHSAIS